MKNQDGGKFLNFDSLSPFGKGVFLITVCVGLSFFTALIGSALNGPMAGWFLACLVCTGIMAFVLSIFTMIELSN